MDNTRHFMLFLSLMTIGPLVWADDSHGSYHFDTKYCDPCCPTLLKLSTHSAFSFCNFEYLQCIQYCRNNSQQHTTTQRTRKPVTHAHITTTTRKIVEASTTPKPESLTVTCDKIQTLDAIARSVPKVVGDSRCITDAHGPSHAFVKSLCNITHFDRLSPKMRIHNHCNSIPLYAAVGNLNRNLKTSTGDEALFGIFVGCKDNGFKMVTQTCLETPFVKTLTSDDMNTFTLLGEIP